MTNAKIMFESFFFVMANAPPIDQCCQADTRQGHTDLPLIFQYIHYLSLIYQNNNLLEQINYAAKDYWGDAERFKFRARIDSYSIEQEVNDGEDRNIKTSFDINVNAYLLNDNYITNLNGVKNTTQKLFTVRKVMLQENAVVLHAYANRTLRVFHRCCHENQRIGLTP